MNVVVMLEGRTQLAHHRDRIGTVHACGVVTLERLHVASAIPFD